MNRSADQLDPSESLVESLTPNAMLVPDEFGLHQKIVWLGDERSRVEEHLSKQLTGTIDAYTQIWEKRAQNQAAYEGLSEKGEAITLPWSRSQVNQQHAWLMERVFSANPVISVRPLGDNKFQVVVTERDEAGNILNAEPVSVSASDVADTMQRLIDYKWTVRLPMRKVLSDWAMEALTDGTVPAVVKLVHDEQRRRIVQRAKPSVKMKDGQPVLNDSGRQILVVNAPEFSTIVDGESVHIVTVPGEDFMVPIGHIDHQRAPWCAMKTEPDVATARIKINSGAWDFCHPPGEEPSEEEIDSVLNAAEDLSERPSKRSKKTTARVDRRRTTDPSATMEVYETFFRWPILQESAPDVIEWVECVGDYHLKAKKLLNCTILDTWNGKRPFLDFFMRQRPNAYSGTCTVEDVAPFQRYASNLFHLQVQNMVMRNISVIMVRKGTSAATFLSKKSNIRPGMVLQLDEMEDFKLSPLGTPIESIANEIVFLKNGAVEMGLSTQYDTATADLSRVTAGAFAQQQDLSKMQPKQVYSVFAERIAALALMYVQFLIQYAPEQVIPSFDPETDAIVDEILRLPRQMVTDQFQFVLTATANDQTPEAQLQEDLVLGQQVMGANNFAMSVLGQIMLPKTPPEFSALGIFMINRSELMLASMFKNARRHDVNRFAMTDEMIRRAMMSLQMRAMQAAAAAQQPGGMNAGAGAIPNAGGGPGLPADQGGQPGPGGVPSEQGGPGMGPPGPMPDMATQPTPVQ